MQLPNGKRACVRFFLWVFGWSRNRLYHKHSGQVKTRRCPKTNSVLSWFLVFRDTLDVMPDRAEYQVPVAHKHIVWSMYMDDCRRNPGIYIQVTTPFFLRLWATFFDNIKVRKWTRFTRCDFCEKHRAIQNSSRSSNEQKCDAIVQLTDHYRHITMERAYADSKAFRARAHPQEVLSLAIDGTDQLPNGLPQFERSTGSVAGAHHRVHYKFTICRNHGLGETICYTHRENIPGNPNLTIEIIFRALKATEQKLGKLPNILHIQFDNCWRENKNTYVLTYLCDLVYRGLFPGGAHISFLPRGHTHNEVDQVASRISSKLRCVDIFTRDQMETLVRSSVCDMKVVRLHRIADTKQVLNPGLCPRWSGSEFYQQRGISTSRFYRVTRKCDGKLEVRSKLSARDQFWSSPWCPTRPNFRGVKWTNHPGVDFCTPDAERFALIDSHLRKCQSRVVNPEHWTHLLAEQQCLLEQNDGQFDWADNGMFKQEWIANLDFIAPANPSALAVREQANGLLQSGRAGAARDDNKTGDDAAQFHFERHPHLMPYGNQLQRHRARYDEERPYLNVASLVVVLHSDHHRHQNSILPPRHSASPQSPFEVNVAAITAINPEAQTLEVIWLKPIRSRYLLARVRYRLISFRNGIVQPRADHRYGTTHVNNVLCQLMTGLNSTGTLKVQDRNTILYKLSQLESREQGQDNFRHRSLATGFRWDQDPSNVDVLAYMREHHDRPARSHPPADFSELVAGQPNDEFKDERNEDKEDKDEDEDEDEGDEEDNEDEDDDDDEDESSDSDNGGYYARNSARIVKSRTLDPTQFPTVEARLERESEFLPTRRGNRPPPQAQPQQSNRRQAPHKRPPSAPVGSGIANVDTTNIITNKRRRSNK